MRLQLISLALGGLLAACASEGVDDVSTKSNDVTAIVPSTPIEQSIPNCWDFAATSWLESLSARPVGSTRIDVSEAYISYLHWFTQLSSGASYIVAQGWWEDAIAHTKSWGWISETDFLALRSPQDYAARHQAALGAIYGEFATGGLLDTTEKRQDPKNIVAALNRAWNVPPAIAAEMTALFGEGLEKKLDAPNAVAPSFAGTHFHSLAEITVGYANHQPVTALDLVSPGPFHFVSIRPPADPNDYAAFIRRTKHALLQDFPVPIALEQEDNLADATGTFQATHALDGTAYLHEVNAFDLSVQTSDFGLLAAGTTETRPEALAAIMRDDSPIVSIRAQNSYYGSYDNVTQAPTLPFVTTSINDYTTAYLQESLYNVTVPEDPNLELTKSP